VIKHFFKTDEKCKKGELRIAAYLGLMTCPSASILDKIKNTLESEEVNQVGSFVWSHLTNLMETSSPLKQNIKSILSNSMLKKMNNSRKEHYRIVMKLKIHI
jgi:hypothetical protein